MYIKDTPKIENGYLTPIIVSECSKCRKLDKILLSKYAKQAVDMNRVVDDKVLGYMEPLGNDVELVYVNQEE